MNEVQYQPLDICHADGLFDVWSDAEVIKYTNMEPLLTLEEVKSRIERLSEFDSFAVIRDGEVIGLAGCPPVNKDANEYGIFYQFRKSAWGQGNASAAAKWLIAFMREKYGNAIIIADVAVDNVASGKILLSLGFEQLSEELIERHGAKLKVNNYKLVL